MNTRSGTQTRTDSAWVNTVINNSDKDIYLGRPGAESFDDVTKLAAGETLDYHGKSPNNSITIIYNHKLEMLYCTIDKPLHPFAVTLIQFKKGYPDKIVTAYKVPTDNAFHDIGYDLTYNGYQIPYKEGDVEYSNWGNGHPELIDPNDYGDHSNYAYNNFNRLCNEL